MSHTTHTPHPGVIDATTDNFDAELLSGAPLLIDFWAPWCGPCGMVAPAVEAVADDFAGKIRVIKVNVDHHPELAQRFNVASIPTLLFMKNGQVVDRTVGTVAIPALKAKAAALLG